MIKIKFFFQGVVLWEKESLKNIMQLEEKILKNEKLIYEQLISPPLTERGKHKQRFNFLTLF